MNRYRTIPALGSQKASANTVCQKCLKKGHYSYECKASNQDRPYVSRPSRTQQLLNPKLKPKLSSDTPNDLLESKGIADRQLAEAEARRNGTVLEESRERGGSPRLRSLSPPRSRSRSNSSDSVSTISTARSRTRSRSFSQDGDDNYMTSRLASGNPSKSPPRQRRGKRKQRSLSSSHSRSPESSRRRVPGSHRKSRRHRTISPVDRGRPSSIRRGSHRSRSNSPSMDVSQVTKHRRSLESGNDMNDSRERHHRGQHRPASPAPQERHDPRQANTQPRHQRKERSLSPYSKRLALTQAMNM